MVEALAAVLFSLASVLGRLPWLWLRELADVLASASLRLDTRESAVARCNVALAYPELLPAQQALLHRAVVHTTARQALETLRMWTRPPAATLAQVCEVHGLALFDAALASGRGLIVAAPHYGSWELLNRWLASRTSLAILYRPPASAIGEAFLRRARDDAHARVTQVRAEGPGIRQLFKRLRDGGVVGILPDQQPKAGDGVFAPFFGLPTLTMTLLPRLAERSGAVVLFAYCERIGGGPGFALHIDAAPDAVADADPAVAAAAVNAAVERIARRDPAQYQWTYKRFKAQPSGRDEDNPYEALERRR